jgi:hypothetical protein
MKTHRDPLIEEVRRARMELSSEFGHDIKKLCAFLRKEERKHPPRKKGAHKDDSIRLKRPPGSARYS